MVPLQALGPLSALQVSPESLQVVYTSLMNRKFFLVSNLLPSGCGFDFFLATHPTFSFEGPAGHLLVGKGVGVVVGCTINIALPVQGEGTKAQKGQGPEPPGKWEVESGFEPGTWECDPTFLCTEPLLQLMKYGGVPGKAWIGPCLLGVSWTHPSWSPS